MGLLLRNRGMQILYNMPLFHTHYLLIVVFDLKSACHYRTCKIGITFLDISTRELMVNGGCSRGERMSGLIEMFR